MVIYLQKNSNKLVNMKKAFKLKLFADSLNCMFVRTNYNSKIIIL